MGKYSLYCLSVCPVLECKSLYTEQNPTNKGMGKYPLYCLSVCPVSECKSLYIQQNSSYKGMGKYLLEGELFINLLRFYGTLFIDYFWPGYIVYPCIFFKCLTSEYYMVVKTLQKDKTFFIYMELSLRITQNAMKV